MTYKGRLPEKPIRPNIAGRLAKKKFQSKKTNKYYKYYKLTQNSTNRAHNAGCALRPRERSHGRIPVGATLHESGFELDPIRSQNTWVRRSALTGTQLNATRF